MHEKLDIYDLLGVVVPGVLVICALPLAIPEIAIVISTSQIPDNFAFLGLLAASIFVGYLVQSIASLAEWLLNKSWGGRPSEMALDGKLSERYLPADSASRIRSRLGAVAGAHHSTRSLFLIAMQRAETAGNPRVARFNALYAYHRALIVLNVVLLALFLLSFRNGVASMLTWGHNAGILISLAVLLILLWHRTKQRAFYYVREVLLTADRCLSDTDPHKPPEGQ